MDQIRSFESENAHETGQSLEVLAPPLNPASIDPMVEYVLGSSIHAPTATISAADASCVINMDCAEPIDISLPSPDTTTTVMQAAFNSNTTTLQSLFDKTVDLSTVFVQHSLQQLPEPPVPLTDTTAPINLSTKQQSANNHDYKYKTQNHQQHHY
jgi:hypothetical protein